MRRIVPAVLLLLALALSFGVSTGQADKEETVAFNVESKKYHCLSCKWALRCTKNCIEISRSEAKRRRGVACKVCGGSCR